MTESKKTLAWEAYKEESAALAWEAYNEAIFKAREAYEEAMALAWEDYKEEAIRDRDDKEVDRDSLSYKAGWQEGLSLEKQGDAYVEGIQAGIKEVKKLALEAIADEPEFSHDMPDKLWNEMNSNREITTVVIRDVVRLTKNGITERLLAKLKELDV